MKKYLIILLLLVAIPCWGADTKISELSTVNPAAADLFTGLQGGANVNFAWGANLVALKGLTFADASIIQLTGAGATAVLTSGGNDYFLKSATDNSALMFATPAEVRTALGLVIGTNVQAYDANLTAIADAITADVSLIQWTGAGTGAVLTSGGNNYFLKSSSDNSALEFATPANALTAIGGQAVDSDLTTIASLSPVQSKIMIGDAVPAWSTSAYTLASPGAAGAILYSDGTNWTRATSLNLSAVNLPSSDASPATTAGQIRHDTTVAGLLSGALAWWDGDEVRYLVDLDVLPSDDGYAVTYNATDDKFVMSAVAPVANPIFTGVVDIPVGATTDAEGEITIDTTSDQLRYYGAAQKVLPSIQYASFVIPAPAATDDIIVMKAPYGMTIISTSCIVQGTTSVHGQLQECDSAGANCADTDDTDDITCDADGAADDGTLSNASIDSGDWIMWKTTSIADTPTFLTVTFKYLVVAD